MGQFYRATREEWAVGHELVPRARRAYEEFDQPELERVMEAACINCHFSRLNSYFSFPQAAWAVGFYITQGRSAEVKEKHTGKLNLYVLEATDSRVVPYALVYQISLMLQSGQRSVAEVLAHEYWHTDESWSFPEVLLPAARVVGIEAVQADTETLVETTKRALEPDRRRARERVIAAGGKLISPISLPRIHNTRPR